MNSRKKFFVKAVVLIALAAPTFAYADTVTIYDYSDQADAYWGGRDNNDGMGMSWSDSTQDVIGGSMFAVDTMTVSRTYGTNGSLTVTLSGDYFKGQANEYEFIGDLFLSNNGWNPYSTGSDDLHHASDTITNGEAWEYVLKLDTVVAPQDGTTSGTISLYAVNPDGIRGPQDSEERGVTHNGLYRIDQPLWYDPDTGQPVLALGTWALDPITGTFTFSLEDVDLSLYGLDVSDIGLSWTMSCGNDVVAGSTVPEPATMLLFAAGLSSLAAYRRRAKK